MIGGLAILDEVRQEWMRAYRTTCAEPRTERNRARLACLHETRDAVARTTTALADPAVSFDMNRIIPLATSLAMCSVDLGFGDDDKDEDKNQDEDKDHAFPWMQPPGPPIPPVPPPPEPPRH